MKNESIVVIVPIYKKIDNPSSIVKSIVSQDRDCKIVLMLGEEITSEDQKMIEELFSEYEYLLDVRCQLKAVDFGQDLLNVLKEYPLTYFTLCQELNIWKKDYIHKAINFLAQNPEHSAFMANSYCEEKQGEYVDIKHRGGTFVNKKEHHYYGIDDYLFRRVGIALNGVYRNDFWKKQEEIDMLMQNLQMEYDVFNIHEALFLWHIRYGKIYFLNENMSVLYGQIENSYVRQLKRIWQCINMSKLYGVVGQERLKKKAYEDFLIIFSARQEPLEATYYSQLELELSQKILQESQNVNKQDEFRCYQLGEKNPDKVFILIYGYAEDWGFYTTFFGILPIIAFALKNGCIPIIDLKNHYMENFQDIEKAGKENAWEYFYRQISEKYQLEEVYQSKNVILCDLHAEGRYLIPDWNSKFPIEEDEYWYWHEYITQILLNEELRSEVDNFLIKAKFNETRVLGVSARAAYVACMKKGAAIITNHPVQPELKEIIETVERYIEEQKCDKIFLAVDDREWFDTLLEKFGDKCLYVDRPRYHQFKNGIPVEQLEEKRIEISGISKREQVAEYVVETYILSKCSAMFCGKSSASQMAYFLNGKKYEYIDIYDRGVY